MQEENVVNGTTNSADETQVPVVETQETEAPVAGQPEEVKPEGSTV